MAKLVIYEEIAGEEPIFEDFELVTTRVLIGASEDNNLILDVPGIDPIHASLELRNERWILQDLGGPGGTFLNGVEIEGPHKLKDDDLIEVSTVKIRFYENEAPVHAAIETGPLPEAAVPAEPAPPPPGSGRVWFGQVAGATLAVIFLIVFLFILADYLGLLRLSDLLPPLLGN